MDLSLSESQLLVQKTARDFATRVLAPVARTLDEEERFPNDLVVELGRLGLLSVNIPESLGGASAGVVAYALAMQEIAQACAATAVAMAVTNMVGEVIASFGTEEQKAKYCPRLSSGELVCGSFALSEPEAGSDPGSMRTTARLLDDDYVIDGTKQWITSGAHAGVFVVWARTGDKETHPGTRGISCFLVDKDTPGLRIGRAEDKMGIRSSNTVALHFDQCRVPKSALLGGLHQGFRIAMMALDGGRIGVSAQAIGIARAALAASIRYAKERKQFGKAIAEFQAIQWKLADMQTRLDAAHLLCLRAAFRKDRGLLFSREASMAKVFATEASVYIANEAVQIHGGYGYTREFSVQRHYRDARVTMIYEGTSEVQRMVIARQVLSA